MKDLIILLNKISRLDLSSYPSELLANYIDSIGTTVQIENTFEIGTHILRARPNSRLDERFTTRDQLSYKPEKYNNSFQRASTPNKTMFYGSFKPNYIGTSDIDSPRLTATLEASDTFRNNRFISNERVTFSKWEVIKPIRTLIVLNPANFNYEDTLLTYLNSQLEELIKADKILATRTRLINHFFSDQFSKKNIRFDYDYIISALYTDMIIRTGFDGIVYPSVKTDYKSYNVCLTTDVVDQNLKLIAAGEGRILKVGYLSEVIPEYQVKIEDDSIPFEYEKMNDQADPEMVIEELYKSYKK